MDAKDIGGSVLAAAFTVMILAAVFSLAAPGPFSQVLNTIQAVDDFVIGAITISAAAVGYSMIKQDW